MTEKREFSTMATYFAAVGELRRLCPEDEPVGWSNKQTKHAGLWYPKQQITLCFSLGALRVHYNYTLFDVRHELVIQKYKDDLEKILTAPLPETSWERLLRDDDGH